MRQSLNSTTSRHGSRQAMGAVACLFAALLMVFPSVVAAREPARPAAPVESRHPTFVTETDEKKWDDCIWAAGAMLIEEWTGRSVDRTALRAASGAHSAGATDLRELRRGAANLLGLDLPASPRLGDRMTWRDLLHRLAHGGGAVVVGWYSSLPSRLSRWDRKLARMDPTADDGHAMFVTDYRPRTGKLWLMDPLGRGDYIGEWVDARVIRDFVWTTSWGYIYAAATPAPKAVRSPLKYVSLGAPVVIGAAKAGTAAQFAIPVALGAHGSLGSIQAGLRAEATFEPIGLDQPLMAGLAPVESGPGSVPSIAGQPVTVTSTGLTFSAALPTVAGGYLARVRLLDARGRPLGGPAATLAVPVGTVAVWGDYGAVYGAGLAVTAAPGAETPLLVHVLNAGDRDWIPLPDRAGEARLSTDQVVASWLERPDLEPAKVSLVLAAGGDLTVNLTPTAPMKPGVYHLQVDVVDPIAGSFAARGVPPLVITVTVADEVGPGL